VRIDYAKVEEEIRWEDSKGTGGLVFLVQLLSLRAITAPGEIGGEGIFPHI
jgi:uncharacterized protein (DUF952 family)